MGKNNPVESATKMIDLYLLNNKLNLLHFNETYKVRLLNRLSLKVLMLHFLVYPPERKTIRTLINV